MTTSGSRPCTVQAEHKIVPRPPVSETDVSERIARCIGSTFTYAELSRRSGIHVARVRRYMLGHAPSVDFVAWVIEEFGANPHFVLLGDGPMTERERQAKALQETPVSDLFAELARRHVELETRIRECDRSQP